MKKTKGHLRTSVLLKNIKIGFWFKIGSLGINFLLISMLFSLLGTTNYGIWLLITSIVGWSSLFDFGISSSLRNKFAGSMATGDVTSAKKYVSTAYFLIAFIALTLAMIISIAIQFFDWNGVLNVGGLGNGILRPVITIAFVCLSLKLVFNLISTLLVANQLPYLADGINFGINILSLAGIWTLKSYSSGSLISVGLILSVTPLAVLIVCSGIFFLSRFRHFIPSFDDVDIDVCKELLQVGSRFFVIQIAGIIIFSTDNLIITQLFGPGEVANYYLAFKYFGVITLGFAIISNPLWSAYTEAIALRDYSWVRETTGKLQYVWLLFAIVTFILFIASKQVYTFWIGKEVAISWTLSASMAFYVTTYTWGSIFVNFVNGAGKIRLQVIFSVVAGIVNIPLSVLLAKFTFLGPSGVILATTVCLSYGPVVSYYQYQKILNKTANGIWNQ